MTNLVIGYINRGDTATLTASPVASSTAPVTYLQNDSRGYQMRAAAVGAQQILGQWGGTAYTIGCVRLDRTNMADGDTWRIQLYSDTAWTTQVYDSGTIAPFTVDLFDTWSYSNVEKIFTQTANVKSFKITVTTAAIFQASRLFVGPYTTAEYNPKIGIEKSWGTGSQQTRRDGGSFSVYVRPDYEILTFDMIASSEAERSTWMEIGRYCMNTKTVWVSAYPGLGTSLERDYSVMGKFEQSPTYKMSNHNFYDFSVKLLGL